MTHPTETIEHTPNNEDLTADLLQFYIEHHALKVGQSATEISEQMHKMRQLLVPIGENTGQDRKWGANGSITVCIPISLKEDLALFAQTMVQIKKAASVFSGNVRVVVWANSKEADYTSLTRDQLNENKNAIAQLLESYVEDDLCIEFAYEHFEDQFSMGWYVHII